MSKTGISYLSVSFFLFKCSIFHCFFIISLDSFVIDEADLILSYGYHDDLFKVYLFFFENHKKKIVFFSENKFSKKKRKETFIDLFIF